MATFSSRPQPKADKTEIKLTAERLMNIDGKTTTLDVKNHLRNRGFLAFQNEISALMEQLAHEDNWKCVHNGRFRIYSLPVQQSTRNARTNQSRRISRPPSAHPRSNWVADLLRVSLN